MSERGWIVVTVLLTLVAGALVFYGCRDRHIVEIRCIEAGGIYTEGRCSWSRP